MLSAALLQVQTGASLRDASQRGAQAVEHSEMGTQADFGDNYDTVTNGADMNQVCRVLLSCRYSTIAGVTLHCMLNAALCHPSTGRHDHGWGVRACP